MKTKQEIIYVLIVYVAYQVTAKVPVVCQKSTLNAWKADLHHRFDEGGSWDCPASTCGGQCVALVKCECGAPYTGLWSPGQNVAANCHAIQPGTVIATFEGGTYHNRAIDHAAVFLGCTQHGFHVMEQGCETAVRYSETTAASSHYHKFSVVMTDQSHLNPAHHCSRRIHSGC